MLVGAMSDALGGEESLDHAAALAVLGSGSLIAAAMVARFHPLQWTGRWARGAPTTAAPHATSSGSAQPGHGLGAATGSAAAPAGYS